MKQLAITFTIILSFFLSTNDVKAQNTREALIYMNELIEPIASLKDETWHYLKAVTRDKGARKVESKRKKLVKGTKTAKALTMKQKGFEGDDSLKTAIIDYLDMTYTILNEDFEKILDMEEIAEQSYDAMEAYMMAKEKGNDKLNEASAKMTDAQSRFAKKNGITLEDDYRDKTLLKIEKANKALKYYNQIYLIFFKVYKQEMYVLDAVRNNDVNALQQNANSLTTLADEGLAKLEKEVEAFQGDQTLIRATKELLLFYKREAVNDFPKMVDFFIAKDNFDKIKQSVESKSKKTKQDIDKYNKASADYNRKVAIFNRVNETNGVQRNKYLKIWNTKVNSFFEKYSK